MWRVMKHTFYLQRVESSIKLSSNYSEVKINDYTTKYFKKRNSLNRSGHAICMVVQNFWHLTESCALLKHMNSGWHQFVKRQRSIIFQMSLDELTSCHLHKNMERELFQIWRESWLTCRNQTLKAGFGIVMVTSSPHSEVHHIHFHHDNDESMGSVDSKCSALWMDSILL